MSPYAMLALLVIAWSAFGWSAARRWKLMRAGAPSPRFDRIWERLLGTYRWAFKQERMDYYQPAGIAHKLIFLGFVVLLLRTLMLWGRGFSPTFSLWVLAPWQPLGRVYEFAKDSVATLVVGGTLVFFYYRLIKPLNFTVSMAMYLVTVVILLDYLRASMWWKKVIGWGISISILTAITCITMQAARGTTSHFNNSTSFNSAVSSVMDIVDPVNGVFILVLLIFALRFKYDVSRSSQLAITFGLFLFLAGSAIGGVMVAQGQSVVGVAPEGPGLPVVNWSTTGGDFRVAHFLGIHAIQILPIAGWLIDGLKALPRRAKPTTFMAISAGYVLLMGFLFIQAMNGVPLVRM